VKDGLVLFWFMNVFEKAKICIANRKLQMVTHLSKSSPRFDEDRSTLRPDEHAIWGVCAHPQREHSDS
jgi:hypothetical protein